MADELSRNVRRQPKAGSIEELQLRLDSIETSLATDFITRPTFQNLGIKTNSQGGIDEISADLVRAGALESTNWSVSAGSRFDLDNGTFQLGGSSAPKLSWDGSTLSLTGSMTITAGSISIGSGNTIFKVDSSGNHWAGHADFASAPFRVSNTGALVASSANITGVITATSGSFTGTITSSSGAIGGFTITASSLHAGDTRGIATGTYAFWAGSSNQAAAPFRVTSTGDVTCTNLTVTGGSIPGSIVTSGINASNITTGTLTAIGITSTTITSSTISGDTITGGTISGTTISGGSISGTTITGSTLQTGTSGENVNITASVIQVRDGTDVKGYFRGNVAGSAELRAGRILMDSGSEIATVSGSLALNAAGGISIDPLISDLLPNIDDTYDLGSGTYYYNSGFVKNMYTNRVLVEGTAGAGNVEFVNQSANPSAPGGSRVKMYTDGSDNLKFRRSNGQTAYINLSAGTISTWA